MFGGPVGRGGRRARCGGPHLAERVEIEKPLWLLHEVHEHRLEAEARLVQSDPGALGCKSMAGCELMLEKIQPPPQARQCRTVRAHPGADVEDRALADLGALRPLGVHHLRHRAAATKRREARAQCACCCGCGGDDAAGTRGCEGSQARERHKHRVGTGRKAPGSACLYRRGSAARIGAISTKAGAQLLTPRRTFLPKPQPALSRLLRQGRDQGQLAKGPILPARMRRNRLQLSIPQSLVYFGSTAPAQQPAGGRHHGRSARHRRATAPKTATSKPHAIPATLLQQNEQLPLQPRF